MAETSSEPPNGALLLVDLKADVAIRVISLQHINGIKVFVGEATGVQCKSV